MKVKEHRIFIRFFDIFRPFEYMLKLTCRIKYLLQETFLIVFFFCLDFITVNSIIFIANSSENQSKLFIWDPSIRTKSHFNFNCFLCFSFNLILFVIAYHTCASTHNFLIKLCVYKTTTLKNPQPKVWNSWRFYFGDVKMWSLRVICVEALLDGKAWSCLS